MSCQLNQWIDLIFGYKQKGPEAVCFFNLIIYEESVKIYNSNIFAYAVDSGNERLLSFDV